MSAEGWSLVGGLGNRDGASWLQAAVWSGLVSAVCVLLGCEGGFSYTVGGHKNGGSRMTIEQRLDQL